MIQTVAMAQELFSKAALVDHASLDAGPEEIGTDCGRSPCCRMRLRPTCVRLIREWRKAKGLPENPLAAFRASGYLERIAEERASRNLSSISSYA